MPTVQRVRQAKQRVAVTALVAMVILGTLVFLLTGGTLVRPQVILYLYLPDATGIGKASPVRVDGIQVGKVQSVQLSGSAEPTRVVKVTMAIDRDRLPSITEDSTAQTGADTLIGDQFIQITTGRSPKRAQPGSEIAYKGSPDLMKSLDLSQFRVKLDQMDKLLTDIEQGRTDLGQFIRGDRMYRDLQKRTTELAHTVHSAAASTGAIGHELYTQALYQRIREPFLQLDQTLALIQSGQGEMGQMFRDDAQYQQLRDSIVSLRQSIHTIGQGEWMRSDTMHTGWERMIVGLIAKVDEFNASPLFATTAVYDNLTGAAKELRSTMQEFREHPEKFLRMQLF